MFAMLPGVMRVKVELVAFSGKGDEVVTIVAYRFDIQ
jgi:hypothetical protein